MTLNFIIFFVRVFLRTVMLPSGGSLIRIIYIDLGERSARASMRALSLQKLLLGLMSSLRNFKSPKSTYIILIKLLLCEVIIIRLEHFK